MTKASDCHITCDFTHFILLFQVLSQFLCMRGYIEHLLQLTTPLGLNWRWVAKQNKNKQKKTVPKGQLRTFLVKWAKTLGWERVKSIFNLSWKEAGGQRNSPSHHLSIRSCTESRSSMWVYSECINRRHVFPKFVLHISKAFKDCRIFYCRHAKFWMLIK